jgi:hypothetical protein
MVAAGLATVALLGAWHLAGLMLLRRLKPSGEDRQYLAVLTTFWGLLLLHFSEIAWGAVVLALALALSDTSIVTRGYGTSAGGLLYLSGITFTTLGYTDQSVAGPARMMVMLQSLGGFMLLTWSATFVYSLWEEKFRSER